MSGSNVSVIIPLYNKEKYIVECLNSVLSQSFTDINIVIVDDHSTDNSLGAARSVKDSRISIFTNENNLGTAGNANRCFDLVDSKFIIRLDADDIMPTNRIKTQIEYLLNHPDVAVVAGVNQILGSDEKSEILMNESECRDEFIFTNPVSQGTAAFNMEIINELDVRYIENGPDIGEDWLFFYLIKKNARVVNLNEVFNFYRKHSGNISNLNNEKYDRDIRDVLSYIFNDIGIAVSKDELGAHLLFRNRFLPGDHQERIDNFVKWSGRLREENKKLNFIKSDYLEQRIKKATDFLFYNLEDDKNAYEYYKKFFVLDKTKEKYLRRKKIKDFLKIFRK